MAAGRDAQRAPVNQFQYLLLMCGLVATLLAIGAWTGQLSERIDKNEEKFKSHVEAASHPRTAESMAAVEAEVRNLRDGQKRILDKLD